MSIKHYLAHIIIILISIESVNCSPYSSLVQGKISYKNMDQFGFLSIKTREGIQNIKILKETTNRLLGNDKIGNSSRFFIGKVTRSPLKKAYSSGVSIVLDVDNNLDLTFLGRRSGKTFSASGSVKIEPYTGRLKGSFSVHRYNIKNEYNCGKIEGDFFSSSKTLSSKFFKISQSSSSKGRLRNSRSNIGSNALNMSISIDADYDYYRYRSKATKSKSRALNRVKDDIRGVINGVEAIYFNQLGIELEIAALKVDSSNARPYRSRNPEILLEQFRRHVNKTRNLISADEYHLFTGKELSDSVVGLAYVGSVCRDNAGSYAYSLSKRTPRSLHILVTAHELGHTLGASHIDGQRSLMSPVLNQDRDTFIDASLLEIEQYISQYGSCF